MTPHPQSDQTLERDVVTPRVLEVVSGLVTELRGGRAPAAVSLNDSLERDLGVSSLERVELLLRLERELGVRLPDVAVAEAATPADLVDAVVRASPALAATNATTPAVRAMPGAAAAAPTAARSLVEVLRWHVDATPDRTHIILREGEGRERPITYADLWNGASGIAGALADRGVKRGETVALMLRTEETFFTAFFGVLMAGAIPVPIYPPVRADRIEEYVSRQAGILASAGARLLVTFKEVERVGSFLGGRAPDLQDVVPVDRLTAAISPAREVHLGSTGEAALIQYTSGSTGNPKGVLLTHANLLANLRALGQALDLRRDDVVVSWLPLYHDMGLIGAWLGALYYAMPLAVMSPLVFLSRPSRWLRAIHAHGGTISPAPNFAYDIAVRKIPDAEIEGLDLSSWRLALNGSEAVSPDTIHAFTERFAPYGFRPEAMCPVYGLAETSVGLTVPPLGRGPRVDRVLREPFEHHRGIQPASADAPRPLRFVSCGWPIPGHDVRIVDEAGHIREERVEGLVQFRGPSVTSGYYRNPDATAAAFAGEWMDSGDFGYWADGELFITGRRKDLIIRGGRNFTPQEVEALVGTVPGVRQGCVAAFGVADPAIGTERLVVIAETRERDASQQRPLRREVVARTIDALGAPPDEVLIVPPGYVLKTSSGKIRRSAMREAYVRGDLLKPRPSAVSQWARVVAGAVTARVGRAAVQSGRLLYTAYAAAVLAISTPLLWVVLRVTPTGLPAARVMKAWSRAVLALGGLSPHVSGAEHLRTAGPAMLVANHASYVDAVVLMAALGADFRFVAKHRLASYPFLGTVIRRTGHVTVERTGQSARLAGADAIVAALGQGTSVFTFPEGTFFRASGILPFRLGAFRAAVEAGRPVVPIALRGTRAVLRDGSWVMRPGRIDVIIGPPLPVEGEGWPEMVRLRDLARTTIVRQVGEPPLERLPER
jgi:1-acyl-sn-glycerol-3-phosphate acyltransferase